MGAGTIFGLEEQKLVKTIKTIEFKMLLYAMCIMCIFRKRYNPIRCIMESGAKPAEAGEFSRNFVLLLLTTSYRKKLGEEDVPAPMIWYQKLVPKTYQNT